MDGVLRNISLWCVLVNGNWGSWTSLTSCSGHGDCDGITDYIRTRVCDSPAPSFGGKPCLGNDTQLVDAGKAQLSVTPCSIRRLVNQRNTDMDVLYSIADAA